MRADVPVFCVDERGKLTLLNEAFRVLTGYARSEILGHPLPVDDRVDLLEWAGSGGNRAPVSRQVALVGKDGARTTVLLILSEVEGARGAPKQLLGIAIDPLAARRMSRHQIQTEKMAAVSMLASGIAHGFNNLHGIVKGLLDINLRNTQLLPELRKDLETMHQTVGRAIKITEDLRAFARQTPAARAPANVVEIVSDLLKIVQGELECEGIDVRWSPPLDELLLLINGAEISHVILELIANARRAMAESVTKVLTIATGVRGGRGFVEVADSGRGMSSDEIAQAFDPFFTGRVSARTTKGRRERLPLGLGLSICHTIVEEHGGEIDVESTPGEGTRLTVWLPLAEGDGECCG